jgi:hypothetical protein
MMVVDVQGVGDLYTDPQVRPGGGGCLPLQSLRLRSWAGLGQGGRPNAACTERVQPCLRPQRLALPERLDRSSWAAFDSSGRRDQPPIDRQIHTLDGRGFGDGNLGEVKR